MSIETTTLESYFEFLDGGETIRIKGHRVGIDLILERYKAGMSPEQIAEEFETITLEDIYATITYYLRHKQHLDAWLDDITSWTEQDIARHDANPSTAAVRLKALAQQQRNEQQTPE
ncbi:MAG TPA: DUF433 domain-containing protein [Ktedonobacterales bacterium]|jgi:uncharacterized protein (DUF433 family)